MNPEKTEHDEQSRLPQINVFAGTPAEQTKNEVVKAEQIINFTNEIMDDIRDDRTEVSEILKNFIEMVINEGDATQGSKEALVNLLKIKSEIADKKTRVLDLSLRAFMRDRSIPGIAAHQHNEYKIIGSSKKNLLKALEEEEKKNAN